MPTLSTFLVFLAAGFVLVVIPGPNVIYIVARGLHGGRRAAIAAAFGVEVGTLIHVAAATVGLSALLVSSATAFSVVKYLGAAYLIYLGIRVLTSRGPAEEAAIVPVQASAFATFRQGVIVNVLNPKTALFFLAFLPQFVDPGRGSIALQTFMLGATLAILGLTCDLVYGVAAGSANRWLRGRSGRANAEKWISGTIYLGLGVTTALTGSPARK